MLRVAVTCDESLLFKSVEMVKISRRKGTPMDYEQFFADRIAALKDEGRYRRFAQLERRAGRFPAAFDHVRGDEVTVWCSNDYLGMGQHADVLAALHDAADRLGAGAGGTRNISGNTHEHILLERELAD